MSLYKKIKQRLNWQLTSILVLAGLLLVVSLPSQYQPSFLPTTIKNMQVNLGLDLQGGSQLEYSIDLRKVQNDADKKQIIEGVLEVINKRVNSLGVAEPNIYTSNLGQETHIIVELAGIKDLEEAKAKVGKTIQLEFKEQNTEQDPNLKTNISQTANTLLQSILAAPNDFDILADKEQKAFPERVTYETTELLFADEIAGERIRQAITANSLQANQVVSSLVEDSAGLSLTQSGQLKQQEGFFILKLLEKIENAERKKTTPKEVEAKQILITYQGATNAKLAITRTKEEAKEIAQNLLAELQKNPAEFQKLVQEKSEDNNQGNFEEKVTPSSSLPENLQTAILALNENNLHGSVIETPSGFHIVKALNIKPEQELITQETQYKFAKLLYSTAPDEWKPTPLTGQYFVRADVAFDQFYRPQVSIQFNAEGAKLFEELTAQNVNKRIAIFVGGELISAPNVSEKIAGGQAIINGDFNIETARDLARDLNTGAIPAPITLVGQYTIGASLGQEALTQSLNAGMIGIGLLVLFMIAVYRVPGLIASLALAIYSILLIFLIKANLPISIAILLSLVIFAVATVKIINNKQEFFLEKTTSILVACFSLFFFTFLFSTPVVLTLAGVAGIILSIGMAVDANILIFERIKEEISQGKIYRKAIEDGFARAWSSIRDSNFSSLITCAILYYFGTSIIRGFALNLAAGILISMFTALTVTQVVLLALNKYKWTENKTLMGFTKPPRKEPFKILNKSRIWLGTSLVLIIISLASIFTQGINQGIDFKGGTLMNLDFSNEEITSESLHQTLSNSELLTQNLNVVKSGENSFLLRFEYIDTQTHDDILALLKTELNTDLEETRFTTIGPTISDNLKSKAVFSLLIALLAIIIYIAFAFRHIPKELSSWKFGACAIIAVAHDVIITLGLFSLLQLEVDALFITALLTIIGFSVHDTIVVFDRIRENLKQTNPHKTPFNQVCNISLTQTMSRSINTSISTLITLLLLLILGATSIHLFVGTLIVGILVGTYSSIFIATPILAHFINRSKLK